MGKNRLCVWEKLREKPARFGGDWLGFWIGLGQSPSLTVLNAKHVWVWIFDVLGCFRIVDVLGLGVSKHKSTGRRINCSNL